MVQQKQENQGDQVQSNNGKSSPLKMSQVTNYLHNRNKRRQKSKSEGDVMPFKAPEVLSKHELTEKNGHHQKNGKNGDTPKSCSIEEDLASSGIHSESTSPDSAAGGNVRNRRSSSSSASSNVGIIDIENDVFLPDGKRKEATDYQFSTNSIPVEIGNFEVIELGENSSNSSSLSSRTAHATKSDLFLARHRLYKSQTSTSTTGSGVDNLAYISEEVDDGFSVVVEAKGKADAVDIEGESSGCEYVDCSALASPSMQEECFLENAHRKCIRDLRKMVQAVTMGQKGISEVMFVDIFSKKDLLRKLFELFDYKKQQELNQDEWIEFLKSRLDREEKQVDFVEVVESVAYALCGEDNVQFDQFCMIFRTKNVLNKFFRLIDRDLDGVVTAEEIMEFISALSTARTNNRLTKESIKWLEHLFRQYVGQNNEITKEDFKKIIQTKNQFFTDRVFDIFDNDASGSISLQEFIDAMHQFAGKEPDDKLRFLFKIYDVDGDGSIQCEELGKVMRACMEENGMKFSDDQIHELTMALFEDADVERRGALTFDALKAQLQKHEGLLENLSISIERWLVPPKPKESDRSRLQNSLKKLKPHQMSLKYFKNNTVYLCWLCLYLVTNVSLFVSRCIVFHRDDPDKTIFLMLARGAGQCLNFNCTFIVVWMLRGLLTFLRSRGASAFLPIDQHMYFHKMAGWFIFFFGILHTVMHLINIDVSLVPSPVVNSGNWTYLDFLFVPEPTSQKGVLSLGLVPGYAFNTGVALMMILTIMVICSLPFVRRGGCFEVFYWTHLLYSAFWIILIIHAPNFWKWFIAVGIIFLIEKVVRYYNWRMGRGRTSVSSGILLPSKVTHLVIRRPPNFEFHPGDYVFIRIPRIAKYEWHPFTISSAPEQSDAIWLHIRAVGEWTTRLYEFFENEQQKINVIDDYGRDRLNTFVSVATIKSADAYNKREFGEDKSAGNVELIAVSEKRRNRLPTVGVPDSQETIDPTSNSSKTSVNRSAQDLSSSVETMSEQDAIIRDKKVPLRLRPRPQLTSTKSLPNVHERVVKLNLRNSPKNFHRSASVNEVEEDLGHGSGGKPSTTRSTSVSSPIGLSERNNRVPRSLRYMRNKPVIISLKTPSYEYDGATATLEQKQQQQQQQNVGGGGADKDRLAEEGRANNCDTSLDVFEVIEANELHPIMGTTRTGQGSLVVGRPLEIYVDGPYGAPSSHIFRAQHAVLIGTGIGVTPFASILQSIMHRYWTTRVCCPRCRFTWCAELPQSVINLKKVDFFWINRDQRSFEWFVHLLSQLEIEQAELGGAMERFLDLHMYITSALAKTDMKAVGLQLALDLLHDREKRDLITGLKTRTHAGRPNWSKVFKQLQDQKKGKVTVFYCGPPALARSLKIKCDEFGFSFRKELF